MSWSASLRDGKPVVGTEITPDSFAFVPQPNEEEGSREQFENAVTAARNLIDAGVVGERSTHQFTVTLSGHANKDHRPSEGWANDMLSINVSQA